jgi:hypothetical protein
MTARGLSGVIPKMINTARDELRGALARREMAESARDSTRQATARARAHLEEVIRQAEAIEADEMRVERERLDDMKRAFAAGSLPTTSASGSGANCLDTA